MKERKANIKILASRYKRASKKEKKNILNEFVLNNGYTRSYASFVLRTYRIKCYVRKSNVVLLAEKNTQAKQKNHLIIYDVTVKRYLVSFWRNLNYLCGKRMAPYLPEYIDKLEQCRELTLDPAMKKKLKQISAATIDRLLKDEKDRYRIKRVNHTKPGRLIKREIEVRKGISWDENQPGFLEIDLVGHEGGDPSGEFAFTLDATDVCTQWTETRTIRNKAAVWVIEAKTPYQRILDHSLIQEEAKQFLKQLYENLNPIKLRKEIVAHKRELFQLVKEKNKDKIDYVSKEEYEKIYLSQKQNKETAHESTI